MSNNPQKAWLGLGANIGNPKKQIENAILFLSEHEDIKLTQRSNMMISKAWGNEDQNDFHNIVIEIETKISPEKLLEICLDKEDKMGRVRKEKWEPRLIDIDIIAFDRIEMSSKSLVLPHPLAHERSFVIDLLREISPETADWIIELTK